MKSVLMLYVLSWILLIVGLLYTKRERKISHILLTISTIITIFVYLFLIRIGIKKF